jgi:toxin-antitoxin system PIN domain toxin
LPDINVWLALSWGGHPHSATAWKWLRALKDDDVLFCRFTEIGLLRLLTTNAVMGDDCLTVKKAWAVYDRWLRDPKVEFLYDSAEVDALFRSATARYSHTPAPKALGDCYLVALSEASRSTLVTLDSALAGLARGMKVDGVLLV